MKHYIKSAHWLSLLLILALAISLGSCGHRISDENETNETAISLSGQPNDNEGQLILATDIELDPISMNNYMQGESSFLCDSKSVYFSDDFFYYTLDIENGSITKNEKYEAGKGLRCDGILVGETVFTHGGKLYQFSDPDAEYQLIGETKADTGKANIELNDFILPYGNKIIYVSNSFENESMILLAPVKSIEKINDWPFAEENDEKTYLSLNESEVIFECNNSIGEMGLYDDALLFTDEHSNIWTINLNSYDATQIVDGSEIQVSWTPKKVVVSGDYIYFSNDIDHKIERIRFDGTGRETFLDGMYGAGYSLYNCDSKNFYHIDYNNDAGEYSLYCTKIENPSESIILATGYNGGIIPYSEPGIYVVGDSVYYSTLGWWRAKTDGSGSELIRYKAVDQNDTEWNLEDLQCQSIAAGYEHTVAVKSDGTVLAVGKNECGECNVSDWKDVISVYAAEDQTIGVKSNGQILLAGALWENQSLSSLRYTTQIDIATGLLTAVKTDGSVVCKGTSSVGANQVDDWKDIIEISTSGSHTVGLRADGTVLAVGLNNQGQCNVWEWTDIVHVVASDNYTVALKQDGSLITTLLDQQGNTLDIEWNDIVDIDASRKIIVAIKSDKTVEAMTRESIMSEWSRPSNISNWTEIVDVVCTPNYIVGLRSDGTTVAIGETTYAYRGVSDWNGIRTNNFDS